LICRPDFSNIFSNARERKISVDDLYRLKLWSESSPDAPDGERYKACGLFKLCGEGKYPKAFLLKGQVAKGKEIT